MNRNDCHLECKRYIKEFIESEFPMLYREDGRELIQFVEAYYEFEEQTRYQFLNESNCMEEKDDIDTTLDEFVVFFKNKYMKDMPFTNQVDNRFIVKHIFDLYKSKGSERSLKLLMQLMYGEQPEVYYPGRDVLRPSHSIWHKPRYLELSHSPMTNSFLTKRIFGTVSKAEAFCESVVTKNINGRLIDVVYLSDMRGEFITGDFIVDDPSIKFVYNYPMITGSMTSATILESNYGFEVGDLLDVRSANGDFGIVKVTEIELGDNILRFNLVDGGFGVAATYANGALVANSITQIYVSDSVLAISNSNISDGEILTQYFDIIELPSPPVANVGDLVTDGTNTGIIHEINGNFITVSVNPTGFSGSTSVNINSTSYPVISVTNDDIVSQYMDSTNTTVWCYNTINGPFKASTTSTEYNIYDTAGNPYQMTRVYGGSGASFQISSLTNKETIIYYTDIIGSNNILSVPYLTVPIDSLDFGFPKPNLNGDVSNLTTVIQDAFGTISTEIGTISALTLVNPGANYESNLRIKVVTPSIVRSEKYELLATTDSSVRFNVGDVITQGVMKGVITQVYPNGSIRIRPLSYINTFQPNVAVTHQQSGTSFLLTSLISDLTSPVMGDNVIIEANVRSEDGRIKSVKVVSSGYGFVDGEQVTLYPQDKSLKSSTATINTGRSGISPGTWLTTTSHLNWSTYIHDNDYYQEYSYDIRSPLSIDRYKDVLENVVHVSGTKMFGSVVKPVVYEEQYLFDGSLEIL